MRKIIILLAMLSIMACNGGGGESPSALEMIRVDFAFGHADAPVSADTYEIGPIESPILLTSEETDGSRMRLIGHAYNEVRITSQHISLHNTNTAEEITEISESWDLAPCPSRDSAWITQWYIYTTASWLQVHTQCVSGLNLMAVLQTRNVSIFRLLVMVISHHNSWKSSTMDLKP